MSNPQAEKLTLDNIARMQQMKVNARQFATTMALELIKAPNYSVVQFKNDPNVPGGDSIAELVGGKVDHITLLAMAKDVEDYIMGNLEKEATDAIDAARLRLDPNRPKIVRP